MNLYDPQTIDAAERAKLEKMVDPDAIARAEERHALAIIRRDKVKAEYEGTRDAAGRAKVTYEKSLIGEADTSPVDAFRAIEEADKVCNAAAEVLNRVCQALDRAEDDIREAHGIAWRPVYAEGCKQRIAAAKKADQARALLREAEADFAKGSRVLLFAHHHGCPHAIPQGAFHPVLTEGATEQSERHLWAQSVAHMRVLIEKETA